MKLLFMHNAIPEYRIPWFKELNNRIKVHFVFTNEKIIKKLYHFDTDYSSISELDYELTGSGIVALKNTYDLCRTISNYDAVLLPPVDTLHEFWISLFVLHAAKKNKLPIAYFWEKWEAPWELQTTKRKMINILTNIVAGIIYRHVDLIFAGSTSSKSYFLRQGIDSKKILIIPDASKTPECCFVDIRKKYNVPENKKIILFFGRLLFQKGLYDLVRAFELIQDKEQFHLLIAGDGDDRERSEKYVKEHKIENVTFAGWVHPSERSNFFAQCDIFAFPGNFYEGRVDAWGLTVVEAIENGKVIVSTNAIGSSIDLISNGENGFILDVTHKDESFIKRLADVLVAAGEEDIKNRAQKYNKKLYRKYTYAEMATSLIKGFSDLNV